MKVVYPVSTFREKFSSNDQCLRYLFDVRFGSDYSCPKCGKQKFYRVKSRKVYSCSCGYQIYPTKGTILQDTQVDLWKWFALVYEMHDSERGISLHKLGARLEVNYRTIWRMGTLIRYLMFDDDIMLEGKVEVDCTPVGGVDKPKTILFGMVEKGEFGRARTYTIDMECAKTVIPYILKHIKPGSTICTDQHGAYYHLSKHGYRHKTVNHKVGEYVQKDDKSNHTCTIDSYWGRLKRSISTTNVSVDSSYLDYYANEFAFRYNRRSNKAQIFTDILDKITSTDPKTISIWEHIKFLKPREDSEENNE